MADRNLDDYNEVEHRIQEFRDKHPTGSLRGDWRVHTFSGADYIAYRAEAWRTPDDPAPGVGAAWELVPGRTPFTRGSELQNAETSAWGRAIIAVGAADAKKGIASRQEVEWRRAERTQVKIPGPDHERLIPRQEPGDRPAERSRVVDNPGDNPWDNQPPGELNPEHYSPEDRPGTADERQKKNIGIEFTKIGISDRGVRLGMVSDMIGRSIISSDQLSRLEADFIYKKMRDERLAREANDG